MPIKHSIWGAVDQCVTLVSAAVWRVGTAGHGGIVVDLQAFPLTRNVLDEATAIEGGLAYYEEDNAWGALALGSMVVRNAMEAEKPVFQAYDIVRVALSACMHYKPAFIGRHLKEFDESTVEGRLIREAIAALEVDPRDMARPTHTALRLRGC